MKDKFDKWDLNPESIGGAKYRPHWLPLEPKTDRTSFRDLMKYGPRKTIIPAVKTTPQV